MKIHIVKRGETLAKIAKRYNLSLQKLQEVNGHIKDIEKIAAGTKVKVPTASVPLRKRAQQTIPVVNRTESVVEELESQEYSRDQISNFSADVEDLDQSVSNYSSVYGMDQARMVPPMPNYGATAPGMMPPPPMPPTPSFAAASPYAAEQEMTAARAYQPSMYPGGYSSDVTPSGYFYPYPGVPVSGPMTSGCDCNAGPGLPYSMGPMSPNNPMVSPMGPMNNPINMMSPYGMPDMSMQPTAVSPYSGGMPMYPEHEMHNKHDKKFFTQAHYPSPYHEQLYYTYAEKGEDCGQEYMPPSHPGMVSPYMMPPMPPYMNMPGYHHMPHNMYPYGTGSCGCEEEESSSCSSSSYREKKD